MDDKHRPQYHFLPPANWMNDPNGLVQWQGTYHLFYQYNPAAPVWGNMHWGHASSPDLVHWRHLPIALAPSPDGPDDTGVWSGCAVDWNGVPTMVYTARSGERESVCLATSRDGLLTWEKYAGNPVIPAPPPGMDLLGFRDPYIWKVGDIWLMVIGAGIRGQGGAILLYSSANLTDWNYLGPLVTGDSRQKEPVWTGDMWECPNFFLLGDRYVLMISAMRGQPSESLYTLYFMGSFESYRFTPEVFAKMDGGDVYFYAPQAFLDESDRRIAFGWAREARSIAAQEAAGWAGVMTLPRLLEWRADGWLGQRPVPEVELLRGAGQTWQDVHLDPGETRSLDGLAGDTLEMDIDFDLGEIGGDKTGAFGLLVRASPDYEEQTEIRLDRQTERLAVDTVRSSESSEVITGRYEIPFDFSGLDHLHLRVFLDRSIIEVYANDIAVITARVYPARSDSTGIYLFAQGRPVTVELLDAWEMGQ